MNCKLAVLVICMTPIVGGILQSQTLSRGDSLMERTRREEYFIRIDRKLMQDLGSTRVMYVPIDKKFPVKRIRVSDGTVIDLADSVTSHLLYLVNEGHAGAPSVFEVIPLAIRRQSVSEADTGTGFGRTKTEGKTFSVVVHLKDITRLDVVQQRQIVDYIVDNRAKERLELKVPAEEKVAQPAFPGHRDFWSLSKVTSHFRVPAIEGQKSGRTVTAVPQVGKPAADRTAAPGNSDQETRQAENIAGKNAFLQWSPNPQAAMSIVTLARDSAFSRNVSNKSISDTSDTTWAPPGLLNSTLYYWRVQDVRVSAGEKMDTTTRFVKTFTTQNPIGARTEPDGSSRLSYALDFSVSRITFGHEILHSEKALGIPGFGLEIGFEDPVLSLLAYQTPAIAWGGKVLLNSTSDKKDLLDKDFLELKFLVKSRFDVRSFYENIGALKYLFSPLVSSERPTLNVAVPGWAVEVATSKWWSLPYLNFYFSTGSTAYADPVFPLGPEENRYAYWSTTQWRGSMAFYFNLDSEPEFFLVDASRKRLNIVRLDVGAGTYNVARVGYDEAGKVASKEAVVNASRIQPYLAAEYVHASQVKTGLGAKASYFDNRVTLTIWVSLFKIGYHELRLEGTDILGPFGRSRYEWEVPGSALIQFRYRLGF